MDLLSLISRVRITSYNVCYTKLLRIENLVEDSLKIENNILDTTSLVVKSLEMLNNDEKIEKIAYFIHIAIADGLSKIAIETSYNFV